MKRLSLLFALFCLALSACATEPSETPVLKFNEKGEFRIVQFTDLHFNCHSKASDIVLERINEVLDAEHPDLAVITGDLAYSTPGKKAYETVLKTIAAHNVPFCTVFGNHDADFGTSKAKLYDTARSFSGCVMPAREGVESPDYTVKVLSHDGNAVASVLYLIDSNAHLFAEDGEFTGYDCIHEDQVEHYKKVSKDYTDAHGGTPLPSVAFFHIPLPEFHDALADENCPVIGTRMEYACAPYHNSGMFAAMKEMGDVYALFVGHDHDNDYALMWQDILMAYGRYTGGNTEYNNLSNGARVIVLKEGKRELDSYIRLKGGEIINRISFPASFTKTDWRTRQD